MNDNIYYINRQSYHKNRSAKRKRLYLLIIFLIVLTFLGYKLLAQPKTSFVLARYGQIVDGFETKGVLIRDESVYYSPRSGYVYLNKKEGERVGYGQKIMVIKDNQEELSLYNRKPGLVSFATDGLEEVLRPSILDKLNIKEFQKIKGKYRQLVNGTYLKKGEIAYRIVDNRRLFLVLVADKEEIQRYRLEEKIFIRPLHLKKDLIEGFIFDKYYESKKGFLVIKTNIFIEEWLNMRWVKFELIKNIYWGIIIPHRAIFTQPEGQGVLVYNSDGEIVFKEVKIVKKNDEKAIVKGLEVGANVIVNPASVNYGRGVL